MITYFKISMGSSKNPSPFQSGLKQYMRKEAIRERDFCRRVSSVLHMFFIIINSLIRYYQVPRSFRDLILFNPPNIPARQIVLFAFSRRSSASEMQNNLSQLTCNLQHSYSGQICLNPSCLLSTGSKLLFIQRAKWEGKGIPESIILARKSSKFLLPNSGW